MLRSSLKLRCLLRLGVDLVTQINWEVLAGMNAEWVGQWLRGKAVTIARRWRMLGMGPMKTRTTGNSTRTRGMVKYHPKVKSTASS